MIRVLPMLMGLLMPACGFEGTAGLPVPGLMDTARIERPTSPNTALAAPADFAPAPDITTQAYAVPPDRLFAAIRAVALAQPRVYEQAVFAAERQVHYVARSDWLNFPDLITVQVTPQGGLIVWSRSVYGESDLGVNRKRVQTWLAALDGALNAPP
jgi:uncharacterized protein (DUF1499 family)